VLSGFRELTDSRAYDRPIVIEGSAAESLLISVLLPSDGDPPEMPKGRTPLPAADVETLRRWIDEGARDDTPESARQVYSEERPPAYVRPPVVSALDFSPDGALLAVSGHHEVLLFGAADGALLARLIGLSERIQTVSFSPDGRKLLVVGGSPARLGEVQVWSVSRRELELSVPVGFDTLYGGAWSPDGKSVSFGGGDHTLRALDAATGAAVFFNGVHEDLVVDTVFSQDGSHLVSVSRDHSMRLFQFSAQQFLDAITSITPGALKGGLLAVDRHPRSDVLLCGGADGTPRTYQMHRTKDRQIGDDYNLLKAYAPLAGRIYALEFSEDGARFGVASSLAGRGEVRLYAADQDPPLWSVATDAAQYALALRPDGRVLAAGGFDGRVRLLDADGGKLVREFLAMPAAF